MIDIDKIKSTWQEQQDLGYDQVELIDIFEAKAKGVYAEMQSYLLKDVLIALGLTSVFILILFTLDVKDFYFWTSSLLLLAVVNTIIFSLQSRALYRNTEFRDNVLVSLRTTRNNLARLKVVSLTLPILLTGILTAYYTEVFLETLSAQGKLAIILFFSAAAGLIALLISRIALTGYVRKFDRLIADMESH